MNSSITRRLIAAATGSLVATGMLLGTGAIAAAQPTDCTPMTMTNGASDANPNALTRAGQIGAASAPSASDGSMPVDCKPASHG